MNNSSQAVPSNRSYISELNIPRLKTTIKKAKRALEEISSITGGMGSIAEFLQLTFDGELPDKYSHLASDYHRENLYKAISSLAMYSGEHESTINDYLTEIRDNEEVRP